MENHREINLERNPAYPGSIFYCESPSMLNRRTYENLNFGSSSDDDGYSSDSSDDDSDYEAAPNSREEMLDEYETAILKKLDNLMYSLQNKDQKQQE